MRGPKLRRLACPVVGTSQTERIDDKEVCVYVGQWHVLLHTK
jgi:hypothetical protein